MSSAVVMRPQRYMLIPPQMLKAVENYYEKEAKDEGMETSPSSTREFVEACHRGFSTRTPEAAGSATSELMVDGLPFWTIVQSISKQQTKSEEEISKGQLCFTRLALQRSYELLILDRMPEHFIPPCRDPLPASLASRLFPKDVTGGITGISLRSYFMTSSPDDDANGCFDSMVRVDDFFQKTSFLSIQKPLRNCMLAYVHDPSTFNNAAWDRIGEQRVRCGDFDSRLFSPSFARNPDVIAHEFGHAVIFYSSNLDYQRQSGAIYESFSDIFAIMEKHYRTKKRAGDSDASWNIGEGLIANAPAGNSLRSMSMPGSGFRGHPILGDDAQVGDMSEYHGDEEPVDYEHDFGGVHKYSGIANHAFYLAATQDGGFSWDRMGKIWSLALTHSQHDIDFAGFAIKTVEAAKELGCGEAVVHIVENSWEHVGVRIGMAPPSAPMPPSYKKREEPISDMLGMVGSGMGEKLARHYAQEGQVEMLNKQLISNALSASAQTIVFSWRFTDREGSFQNREIRFIRPGGPDTIRAMVFALNPTGGFDRFFGGVSGEKVFVARFFPARIISTIGNLVAGGLILGSAAANPMGSPVLGAAAANPHVTLSSLGKEAQEGLFRELKDRKIKLIMMRPESLSQEERKLGIERIEQIEIE